MAATALTELCNMSKNKSDVENINAIDHEDIQIRHSPDFCQQKVYSDPTNVNTNIFQQQLETAAVLMDISKNVTSPSCSKTRSFSPPPMLDLSIINSVIPSKSLTNATNSSEISIQNVKCDTIENPDVPIHTCVDDTFVSINKTNEKQVSTAEKLKCSKLKTYTTTGSERKSPDSITSEDPVTDAATTQLWQVLAHSAGKQTFSRQCF